MKMYRTNVGDTDIYVLEKEQGYQIGIGQTTIYIGQEGMQQENGPIPLGTFFSVMDEAKVPQDLVDRIKKCIIKDR